jgi:hypothetical protein
MVRKKHQLPDQPILDTSAVLQESLTTYKEVVCPRVQYLCSSLVYARQVYGIAF